MRIKRIWSLFHGGHVVFCVVLGIALPISSARGERVTLTPIKDASLYQYDYGAYVAGSWDTYPRADGTSHLHVGDTNNNNGVQRGLIQFDFSEIPANADVTAASLAIAVADVPNRVLQSDVNFWMVAIEGLSEPWNQGPGNEQSPAVPGDTTWFHTEYDPAQHGELGNTSGNEFRDFAAGDGYWPAPGYFGEDDLLDTAPGAGSGGPFDDDYALVFPQNSDIGAVLNWGNDRMLDDIQAWVDGSKANYGWILVGEEWITDAQQVVRPDNQKLANASSKIDFVSRETAPPYRSPPATLTVDYVGVPEPNVVAFWAIGVLVMLWARWPR